MNETMIYCIIKDLRNYCIIKEFTDCPSNYPVNYALWESAGGVLYPVTFIDVVRDMK